ncbi:MAG: hypothetical protein ACRDM2_03650 [Gaiellaceae bacterium]
MRGWRTPRTIAGAFVLAIAVAAVGVAPATGTTTNPGLLTGECPSIMPLSDVSTGMRGTAVSVVRGRTLSTMGAEVLGILRDGVGPGRDIIIVNLTGTVVTQAGGLWAGASGSPVFFRDPQTGKDKLAGAIAYGLAGGASTLAGLTPAEDMNALLTLGDSSELARAITLPTRLASKIAAQTGISMAQLSTISRLKTPLSASGLTDRGLQHMQRAIDRQGLPLIPYMGSSASSNPQNPPGTLRAGDTFAAAMSLGDITVAGVGTTTFVCNGRAVAFGHPFNWTGDTTMAARAGDTITIVSDPVFGSYKLSNIAESVGTLTQDRLAGIVADLGAGPTGSPVTSTVTDLDTGKTRSGRSEAVLPEFLPFLTFEHLFQNVDVTIDRIGPGNAEAAYTIRGTRDGGRTWELTRTTHYASSFDISFDSVAEVSFTAEILQAFEGEEIEVTSVDVPTLEIEKSFEQYQVRSILQWNGARYVAREFLRGRPGQVLKLRVVIKPVHLPGSKNVDLSLKVPANARRSGWVEVVGGGSTSGIPCFIFDEECGEEPVQQTFDQVLAALESAPRGDALVARLRLGNGALRASATKQQDAVVVGRRAIGFLLLR